MKVDLVRVAGVLGQVLGHRRLEAVRLLTDAGCLVLGLDLKVSPNKHAVNEPAFVNVVVEPQGVQPLNVELYVPTN